jgi:signal transduction histidine kinase
VRDQGPGLRPEEAARVFEPFYSRRRGGTGLGLAIAQRIVGQHGGSIHAGNHDEGGAELVVQLLHDRPAEV